MKNKKNTAIPIILVKPGGQLKESTLTNGDTMELDVSVSINDKPGTILSHTLMLNRDGKLWVTIFPDKKIREHLVILELGKDDSKDNFRWPKEK